MNRNIQNPYLSTATVRVVPGKTDFVGPTLQNIAPLAGSALSGVSTISANVQDSSGVSSVSLFLNGTFHSSAAPANGQGGVQFTVDTAPLPVGANSFRLVATDSSCVGFTGCLYGNSTSSGDIPFIVDNPDTQPPTAIMTDPMNGGVYQNPVTVRVHAFDNLSVRGIELYRDGASRPFFRKLNNTGAPQFGIIQDITLQPGQHSLFARVFDAAGNFGDSQIAVFTVLP